MFQMTSVMVRNAKYVQHMTILWLRNSLEVVGCSPIAKYRLPHITHYRCTKYFFTDMSTPYSHILMGDSTFVLY